MREKLKPKKLLKLLRKKLLLLERLKKLLMLLKLPKKLNMPHKLPRPLKLLNFNKLNRIKRWSLKKFKSHPSHLSSTKSKSFSYLSPKKSTKP